MTVRLQNDIHSAGDGFLAIQGCCPFRDDLDMVDGAEWNKADVSRLAAEAGPEIGVKECPEMPPLPVDQNQGVVGRQTPKLHRPDEGVRAAARRRW